MSGVWQVCCTHMGEAYRRLTVCARSVTRDARTAHTIAGTTTRERVGAEYFCIPRVSLRLLYSVRILCILVRAFVFGRGYMKYIVSSFPEGGSSPNTTMELVQKKIDELDLLDVLAKKHGWDQDYPALKSMKSKYAGRGLPRDARQDGCVQGAGRRRRCANHHFMERRGGPADEVVRQCAEVHQPPHPWPFCAQ